MTRRARALPFVSAVKHLIGAFMLLVACGLYVFGTWGPAIQIQAAGPQFLLSPAETQVFSMVRLLHLLLTERNYIPFFCTLIFSFVLPVIKFFLISLTLVVATCCRRFAWSLWLPLKVVTVLRVVCKYQLVDAFSVILLVTFINFVGLSADPLPAAHAYLVYCLLSITTTQWLCHCYSETYKRSLEEKEESPSPQLTSPLLSSPDPLAREGHSDITDSRNPSPSENSEISTSLSVMTASLYGRSPLNDSGSLVTFSGVIVEQQKFCSRVCRRLSMQKKCRSTSCVVEPLPYQGKANRAGIRRSQQFGPRMTELRISDFNSEETGSEGCSPRSASRTGWSSEGAYFYGYVLRLCLLVLLMCASAFALLVCWVRPILTVALVPGRARAFAIEVSTRSMGDVFWRLYNVGQAVSGCGILFVFPILLTFVVYVASIGALGGMCILERLEKARGRDPFSYALLEDEAGVSSASVSTRDRERILKWTKVFARIARVAGDVAMPDVQSFGLLTSFFIVNNIDFFGARLPAVPSGEPRSVADRLLWNFSGFWALLAFGISATQVHRLVPDFPEASGKPSDCGRSGARDREDTDASCSSKATHSGHRRTAAAIGRGEATVPTWKSPPLSIQNRRAFSDCQASRERIDQETSDPVIREERRRQFSLTGTLLLGGLRLALAVVLLLPVWLQPVGVLDVDLPKVNIQLQSLVEYVNEGLMKVLPQSVGECRVEGHNAPTPCVGSTPLDVIRTQEYEAYARWATGLQTTQLQTARFDVLENDRIVLTVSGYVHKLALSLRIGQCITGQPDEECPVLWDNEDSCCDDNTAFTLQVEVACQSTFPYLREATLLSTRVSRLAVYEKVLGIFPVEVADITRSVEDQISGTVTVYLDPENKVIHWTDEAPLSFIEFLNRILAINAPDGLVCPNFLRDAPPL